MAGILSRPFWCCVVRKVFEKRWKIILLAQLLKTYQNKCKIKLFLVNDTDQHNSWTADYGLAVTTIDKE